MENFIYNGINSKDMGVVIKKGAPVSSPRRRIESIEVAGRNGNLHIDNGTYESYFSSLECIVTDMSKIKEIQAWLSGMGKIEFSSNEGIQYDCVIANQIPFEKYLTYLREFPLELEISPIGKKKIETVETITVNGTFEVAGNIPVEPTIEVLGTGDVTITLNGTEFTINNLDSQIPVIIDCDLMNATKDNLQHNSYYHGDFPSLVLGENNISFTGDVTEIKIKYNEGWL